MKNILLLIFCLLFVVFGYSQKNTTKVTFKVQKTDETIYDSVEVMPKFPSGNMELRRYIVSNLQYPERAMENGASGRVFVSFIVNTKGEVTNPVVVQSVDQDLDAEAIRVIRTLPLWNPGTQDGNAVNVRYTIPVSFVLQ